MSGNLEEAIGKAEARAELAITTANLAISALQSFIKPDVNLDRFSPYDGTSITGATITGAISTGVDPGPADVSALDGLIATLSTLANTPSTPPPGSTEATKIGPQTTKGASKIGPQTTKGASKIGPQTTKGATKIGVQTTKGAAKHTLEAAPTASIRELTAAPTATVRKLTATPTATVRKLTAAPKGPAKIGPLTTKGASKHTLDKAPTATVRKLIAAPKGPESFTYIEPTSGTDFGALPSLAVSALDVNTVTGLVAIAPTYTAPTKLTGVGVDVTRAKSDLADLADSVYEGYITAFEKYFTRLVMPTITLKAPVYEALSYTELADTQLLERVTRWGGLFTFLDSIRTSGTAIPEGMATRLYGESRDNEVASFRTGLLGIDTNFANRGFKLPQPASINLYEKEADKYTKALSGANRSITNKMMELYTDVVKFSVTAGIDLEKMVAGVTDHYIDRLLLAAEKTFNLQIEYYNLKVRLYEAEIKLVRDWVDLQRLILEGKLSRLDIYKVKLAKEASDQKNTELYLEGDKLYLEQKKLLVEEYRAQVEEKKASLSYEGAKIEFDKLKLQQAVTNSENAARKASSDAAIGQVQIGAYNAKISSFEKTSHAKVESSEVEIHKYNLEIEAAKVNVQAAALDIEAAKVDVQAAGIDVEAAKVNVQAAGVDVEAAKVDVEAAKVDVQAAGVDVQAAGVDVEAAKVDVQAAGVDVEAAKVDVQAAGVDVEAAKVDVQAAGVDVEAAKVDVLAAGVDVEAAKVDVQAAGVNVEAAKVDVQAAGVDVEAAKVDVQAAGVDVQAAGVDVEAAKVDVQAAGVDVQAAGVDVEAAKVDVQAAGVDVDAAKVDVQAAGVDVEAAKVDVQAAGVDVEAIKADASILSADAQIMQAKATVASAAANIARAKVDATTASSQVSLGYADLALKGLIATQHETVVAGVGYMEAQARLDANNAEFIKAEAAKLHARGEITNNKAQIGLEAAKAAAQIAGGMVQGALSAINVSVGQTSH